MNFPDELNDTDKHLLKVLSAVSKRATTKYETRPQVPCLLTVLKSYILKSS